MKNIILLFCSIIIFLLSTVFEVKAQAAVTATATAEIIEALTTTETSQMNFGRFSPETQGGKVIMTPDGVRSSQGTIALVGGTHTSASF